ncbi:MAG: ribonuclease III, partial [Desulfobacterales bacterium]|nr:ribonuclease III [Desulfobacterales bacterium]
SHMLMDFFPDVNEGGLSRIRSSLVNESHLARIATTINVGPFLKLGKGEHVSHGREKKSILADTFEAIIAAVYLDGGFDAAFKVVKAHFFDYLIILDIDDVIFDPKTQLQEFAQIHLKEMPVYHVLEESGPDHDKTFIIRLTLHGLDIQGIGKSKKNAEQDAAKKAIDIFKEKLGIYVH